MSQLVSKALYWRLMLFFIEGDSITFTVPYHVLCPIQWFFPLNYKSKKSFYSSFSSWLIKASGLHTCLMKLLPIYKNTLDVYVTVISLFNLVKPLERLFFQLKAVLKPAFMLSLAKWNYQSLSQITKKSPSVTLFLGKGCVCYLLAFSFWQYWQDLIMVVSGFSLPTARFWCQGNIQSFRSYFLV